MKQRRDSYFRRANQTEAFTDADIVPYCYNILCHIFYMCFGNKFDHYCV